MTMATLLGATPSWLEGLLAFAILVGVLGGGSYLLVERILGWYSAVRYRTTHVSKLEVRAALERVRAAALAAASEVEFTRRRSIARVVADRVSLAIDEELENL